MKVKHLSNHCSYLLYFLAYDFISFIDLFHELFINKICFPNRMTILNWVPSPRMFASTRSWRTQSSTSPTWPPSTSRSTLGVLQCPQGIFRIHYSFVLQQELLKNIFFKFELRKIWQKCSCSYDFLNSFGIFNFNSST